MLRKFIGVSVGVLAHIGLMNLFDAYYTSQYSLVILPFLFLPALCGAILASIIIDKYWLLYGVLVPIIAFIYLGVRYIFLWGFLPLSFLELLVPWLPSGVVGGYFGKLLARIWHKHKKSTTHPT